MSFLKSKHSGWLSDGTRTPFTGGGGGSPAPTQTTAYNTNIPEYARPYVENMLQSTQTQIYNDDMTGFRPYQPYSSDVNNYFAGFSPLQQSAQQSAYNLQTPGQYGMASGLAGMAGMGGLGAQDRSSFLGSEALGYGQAGQMYGDVGQMYGAQGAQQAQAAAQNAQQQAQRFGQQAVRTGQQSLGYGKQGAGYGAGATNLGLSATELARQQGLGYGAQGAAAGQGAQQLGLSAADIAAQQGLGYGAQGAGYGQAAAGLAGQATGAGQAMGRIGSRAGAGAGALAGNVAGQAMGYGSQAAQSGNLGLAAGQSMADIGMGGLGYGALGTGYGAQAAQQAQQGYGAGAQYAQQATNPNAVAAYMSPYMQNVVDYQKSQALRDFNIGNQLRKSQAVGAGAFGGSRQAIVESEAERALGSQLQGIAATGSQKAFEDAQRQQQFGANLGLQGLQAGYQGTGMGIQGAQTGLQGLGTAMQGQQGRLAGLSAYQQGLQGAQQGLGTALSSGNLGLAGSQQALAGQQGVLAGLNQAGNLYGQGMQGAGYGLQGLQGALAGSAQGLQGYQAAMQGAQTGLQGLQGALAGSAQGLQGFGQGIQGAQAGMQGVQGALAGYNTGLSGVGQQLGAGQLGLQGTAQGIQGAQAGMQGAGYGLQGVQGATQAGQYGLQGLGAANQAAGTLGQLGTQQLAADTSIIGTQSQQGAQQQALEQNKINQAIQDYAIAQQYPMMQLGFMSNMLRGLPMQAQTTQLYQAQPSALQQGIGLAGAGASLFGAGRAEGGVIKMAEGGIADYKYGGAIPEPKLESMADSLSVAQLQERIKDPALTPGERQVFQEALAAKQQIAARSSGIAAAGGGLFNTMGYAGGGILAFADEGLVEDKERSAFQQDLIDTFGYSNARQGRPEVPEYMKKIGAYFTKPREKTTLTPAQLDAMAAKQGVFAEGSPALSEGMPVPAPTAKVTPAGPSAGATGSKASSAAGSEVSGIGGILAGLRKEGPQGELGADYLKRLQDLESGADKRLSRADKIAMAKGFLKFGSTPAPGGIGQAAVAGLGEYTEGYSKALESDEKFRMENAKLQSDIQNLRRAEERGDVKLAAELQEKIEDRANRLQTANISASATGRASDREDKVIQQIMKDKGLSYADAYQFAKGAGRFESNDINALKTAISGLQNDLLTGRLSKEEQAAAKQKIAQLNQRLISIGMGSAGSAQATALGNANLVQNKDGSFNYVPK